MYSSEWKPVKSGRIYYTTAEGGEGTIDIEEDGRIIVWDYGLEEPYAIPIILRDDMALCQNAERADSLPAEDADQEEAFRE